MDRLLLSYPDKEEVQMFNDNEIDEDLITWYDGFVRGIIEQVKGYTVRNSDEEIVPLIAEFTKDGKDEYKRVFNEITTIQNSKDTDEKLKSVLPKMKIYLGRFALLVRFIKWSLNQEIELLQVEKDDVLSSEKLLNYFTKNATLNKKNSSESRELKLIIKKSGAITTKEKIEALMKSEITATKKQIAKELGVTIRTVQRYAKDTAKRVPEKD